MERDQFCPACGRARGEDHSFCTGCGQAFGSRALVPTTPSGAAKRRKRAAWATIAAVVLVGLLVLAGLVVFGAPALAGAMATPTATPTATATPTPSATSTPIPTSTPTPIPTATPVPVTACTVYSTGLQAEAALEAPAGREFCGALAAALSEQAQTDARGRGGLCAAAALLDPLAAGLCKVANDRTGQPFQVLDGFRASTQKPIVCQGPLGVRGRYVVRDIGGQKYGGMACQLLKAEEGRRRLVL